MRIWYHEICNHHDDIKQHVRGVPAWSLIMQDYQWSITKSSHEKNHLHNEKEYGLYTFMKCDSRKYNTRIQHDVMFLKLQSITLAQFLNKYDNTLRPGRDGYLSTDDIFKLTFLWENYCNLIWILLTFVHKEPNSRLSRQGKQTCYSLQSASQATLNQTSDSDDSEIATCKLC